MSAPRPVRTPPTDVAIVDRVVSVSPLDETEQQFMRRAGFTWHQAARINQMRLQRRADLDQSAAGRRIASARTFQKLLNRISRLREMGFGASGPERRQRHPIVERRRYRLCAA